jgi:hypothetical protein
MEYRDRAVAAILGVESRLREELRLIMLDAVAAEAYADVSAIAEVTDAVTRAVRDITANNGKSSRKSETCEATTAQLSPEISPAIVQQPGPLGTRPTNRKDNYPQFFRNGDRLVKIAWSKKDRAPYEHRAPKDIVHTLIAAVRKKRGEGKVFQAADILPLMSPAGDEYPSYQSYLAINWLRENRVILKRGREGYVLQAKGATPANVEQLWNRLRIVDSQ